MDTEESLARGRKRIITGIIITIIIIILAIIANIMVPKWVFNYKYKYLFRVDAKKAIEESLELTLPKMSEIVEYEYDVDTTEYYARVKIEDKSLEYVKSKLSEFVGEELQRSEYTSLKDNYVAWWDIDVDDVQNYYYAVKSYKEIKVVCSIGSVDCLAIITKENDNNYLYLTTSALVAK